MYRCLAYLSLTWPWSAPIIDLVFHWACVAGIQDVSSRTCFLPRVVFARGFPITENPGFPFLREARQHNLFTNTVGPHPELLSADFLPGDRSAARPLQVKAQ